MVFLWPSVTLPQGTPVAARPKLPERPEGAEALYIKPLCKGERPRSGTNERFSASVLVSEPGASPKARAKSDKPAYRTGVQGA